MPVPTDDLTPPSQDALPGEGGAVEPSPREDMNGQLMRLPGEPHIYLIDRGYKRLIPNPEVFHQLFLPWAQVVPFDVSVFPRGLSVFHAAILAMSEENTGMEKVYLIDRNPALPAPHMDIHARHIVDMPVFMRFQFNLDRVRKIPYAVVQAMREGVDVVGPPA
jgi:hypothetical protein